MSSTFVPIHGKPNKNDPYIYLYNNKNNGGKSLCINGKPMDSTCNVLSNCVGWACARFNAIYNEITGYTGIKYPNFCCNAEKFIEVAKRYGLTVSQVPAPGAIMCWQKGATLSGDDGAGHVAIVEEVYSDTQVRTSESAYNYIPAYYEHVRNKGSNGRWGAGARYTFRGFILNPVVKYEIPKLTSPVARNKNVDQLQVLVSDLRVRSTPSTSGRILGYATKGGYYNNLGTTTANGYIWYKIADDNYIAYNSEWINILNKEVILNIGDKVIMSHDAVIYGTNRRFSSWVYNSELYVRNVNGNKIAISIYKKGAITGSVDKKYLIRI